MSLFVRGLIVVAAQICRYGTQCGAVPPRECRKKKRCRNKPQQASPNGYLDKVPQNRTSTIHQCEIWKESIRDCCRTDSQKLCLHVSPRTAILKLLQTSPRWESGLRAADSTMKGPGQNQITYALMLHRVPSLHIFHQELAPLCDGSERYRTVTAAARFLEAHKSDSGCIWLEPTSRRPRH